MAEAGVVDMQKRMVSLHLQYGKQGGEGKEKGVRTKGFVLFLTILIEVAAMTKPAVVEEQGGKYAEGRGDERTRGQLPRRNRGGPLAAVLSSPSSPAKPA